jgi:hypothetical protein
LPNLRRSEKATGDRDRLPSLFVAPSAAGRQSWKAELFRFTANG